MLSVYTRIVILLIKYYENSNYSYFSGYSVNKGITSFIKNGTEERRIDTRPEHEVYFVELGSILPVVCRL